MVPVKIRFLNSSSLSSGWKGPADLKTATDREEKAGELHTYLHVQTQCEHTIFLQEIRLKSNIFFAICNNSEPLASTASTKEETSFRKYKKFLITEPGKQFISAKQVPSSLDFFSSFFPSLCKYFFFFFLKKKKGFAAPGIHHTNMHEHTLFIPRYLQM